MAATVDKFGKSIVASCVMSADRGFEQFPLHWTIKLMDDVDEQQRNTACMLQVVVDGGQCDLRGPHGRRRTELALAP